MGGRGRHKLHKNIAKAQPAPAQMEITDSLKAQPEKIPRALCRDAAKIRQLNYAALDGDLRKVKYLVEEEHVDFNCNISGWTPIMWATRYGQEQAVDYLLGKEIDLTTKNFSGENALILAANAKTGIFRKILERNGNVDETNRNKETALIIVLKYQMKTPEREEKVRLLLARNAKVGLKDEDGKCALDYAEGIKDFNKGLLKELKAADLRENPVFGLSMVLGWLTGSGSSEGKLGEQ